MHFTYICIFATNTVTVKEIIYILMLKKKELETAEY